MSAQQIQVLWHHFVLTAQESREREREREICVQNRSATTSMIYHHRHAAFVVCANLAESRVSHASVCECPGALYSGHLRVCFHQIVQDLPVTCAMISLIFEQRKEQETSKVGRDQDVSLESAFGSPSWSVC